MATAITKASELIKALKDDSSLNLFWSAGSRPAAPGSYSIGSTRVHASAVTGAEKINAIKCIRNDFQCRKYKLTVKFRME